MSYENYAALAISILTKATPEQAFELYNKGKTKYLKDPDSSIAKLMYRYKQAGLTYSQIGEMFGVSADAAHKKIQKVKREVNQVGSKVC